MSGFQVDNSPSASCSRVVDGRGYPLASSWPTIDAIPPGALVLDNGVVKQCVFCFNNEGKDWVDCGRPSWLNQFEPSMPFCIEAVAFVKSGAGYGPIFTLGGASSSTRQLDIAHRRDTGLCQTNIGGAQIVTTSPVLLDAWHKYQIKSDPRSFSVDGDVLTTGSNGSFLSSQNLVVCTNADNTASEYFEGLVSVLRFYDANGNIIDSLDFNKWDGSSIVRFDSGHACTVTDGAPTGTLVKSLVPVSML